MLSSHGIRTSHLPSPKTRVQTHPRSLLSLATAHDLLCCGVLLQLGHEVGVSILSGPFASVGEGQADGMSRSSGEQYK